MTRNEEIRERCENATPGPWEVGSDIFVDPNVHIGIYQRVENGFVRIARANSDVSENNKHNAKFIAHAREDIPFLLAEVDRLQDELQYASDGAKVLASEGEKLATERDAIEELLNITTAIENIGK